MKKSFGLLVLASSLVLVACGPQQQSGQQSSQQPSGATTTSNNTTTTTQGTASVGAEKAKQKALSEAGVNEKDATNLIVQEGFDDGRKIFDVDFIAGGKEYSYEIDAETGQVLQADSEIAETPVASGVTENQVKATVLADMGVKESDLSSLRITPDNDDARPVYDVAIIYNNTEYDYVVDAQSGRIVEKEVDPID